jgi:hypothetical protein
MLVTNLFKTCLKAGVRRCFSTSAVAAALRKGQISQVANGVNSGDWCGCGRAVRRLDSTHSERIGSGGR